MILICLLLKMQQASFHIFSVINYDVLNDVEVHFKLRPDVKPIFYNARKIPFALESKIGNVLK